MECSLSPMFLDHNRRSQLPALVNPCCCQPFPEGIIAQRIAEGIAEGTEELRNLALFVSNELESAKELIWRQNKIHEEKLAYLYNLLSEAQRERDKARDQCAKLQERLSSSYLHGGVSIDGSTITSPNSVDSGSSSSIETQIRLSLEDLEKNLEEEGIIIESLPPFDLIDGLGLDEDPISATTPAPATSPNPSYTNGIAIIAKASANPSSNRVHLPEPPESGMQAMLRSLPERGNLLQAVIDAGPLLQNLLVAGPLPQWRYPPPPVLEPLPFDYFTPSNLSHIEFPFKYPKIH